MGIRSMTDKSVKRRVFKITFFVCLALLLIGYATYGAFVEKVFHPDDRETPCTRLEDGVDYAPIAPWRAFLIQLLNIAGLGPIFGALSGAIWGPSVMLWIVFGTIFAGAVHDFLSGMLSMRNDGASIAEITGIYLGPAMKTVMRVFSVVLLVKVFGFHTDYEFIPKSVMRSIIKYTKTRETKK